MVGGKNSAAEASLELFRGGAHVTLVHRHATLGDSIKYWVRPDIENRIKEGSIPARFEARVVEITPTEVIIEQHGQREALPAEAVFLLTGYHPDAELMTRGRRQCDPVTLVPQMNPQTFETNVPNLFLAGGAVAGRNTGSIFIENGRFHGEKIIGVLAERLEALIPSDRQTSGAGAILAPQSWSVRTSHEDCRDEETAERKSREGDDGPRDGDTRRVARGSAGARSRGRRAGLERCP